MKRLLFLTMVAGLMLAFGGSASAQRGVVASVNNDAGAMRPAAGENISLIVATATEDMPGLGLQRGSQYCVLSIKRGSDIASVYMNKNCGELKFTKFQHKITRVDPSETQVMTNDKVAFYAASRTIAFYRGANKVLTLVFEQ